MSADRRVKWTRSNHLRLEDRILERLLCELEKSNKEPMGLGWAGLLIEQ